MTQRDDKSFETTERFYIVTGMIIIYSNANKNYSNVKSFSNTFIFIHANLVDDKNLKCKFYKWMWRIEIIRSGCYVIIIILYVYMRLYARIIITYTVAVLFRLITKTPCLNAIKTVVAHRCYAVVLYGSKICSGLRCSVCVRIYFSHLKPCVLSFV